MEETIRPRLIGLTGKAGSGKDACGALLRMLGYKRYGFADEVRNEIENSFKDNYSIPLFPDHILADWLVCACEPEGVMWRKPMLSQARNLAQWWGTSLRRTQDPEYWIKKMESKLERETSPVVITDIRFKNEQDFLERHSGVLWLIERPGLLRCLISQRPS